MATVLITGMSGTGKSTALVELARRGYQVVDADLPEWSIEIPSTEPGGMEQVWREDAMASLLDVGPLLRATSTAEIGTTIPVAEVVDQLEAVIGHMSIRRTWS
jgi:predicted ATPase